MGKGARPTPSAASNYAATRRGSEIVTRKPITAAICSWAKLSIAIRLRRAIFVEDENRKVAPKLLPEAAEWAQLSAEHDPDPAERARAAKLLTDLKVLIERYPAE